MFQGIGTMMASGWVLASARVFLVLLGLLLIDVYKRQGQKVEMNYPLQFKAELEKIKLDDPRLSNVWGKESYRITLKTEEKKVTGKYGFVIQQVK